MPPAAHSHDHVHGHSHGPAHAHSHGPAHRHPAATPAFSLLRLSVWQRLAIVLPLAALLWAGTLWVIAGSAS